MKRILLPAGGAILATGLLAAGLAGTAQAQNDVASDVLNTEAKAWETLDFWTASNNAALKNATAFYPDELKVEKIVRGGGYSADTKPGQAVPIGEEKKVTVKSQNVNFPKSIGKVFFVDGKGDLKWCSGTSVQSQYKNLVATAGSCVYDIATNDEVVSKWVFVPGYYQGKTPYGIYVGKQAFTHYDYDVYEDADRDYAFVTVYNGLGGVSKTAKKVTLAEYNAHKGDNKDIKLVPVSKKEYDEGILDPKRFDYYTVKEGTAKQAAGPDFPGAVVEQFEVTESAYNGAPEGKANNAKFGPPQVEHVTYEEAIAYIKKQRPTWQPGQALPAPTAAYPGKVSIDDRTNVTITHFYVQRWYKPGSDTVYLRRDPYIFDVALKDVGRLGDIVGGQGVAWNQPGGKTVRTFGYPFGPHPDGSKPYTGVTPKWCYGKTAEKVVKIPARRVEEQQSLRCPVTAGYTGGPWLSRYSNAKRLGYVTGVTSLIVDTDSNKRYDTITSAIFDGETAAIYKAAAAVWSGKLVK